MASKKAQENKFYKKSTIKKFLKNEINYNYRNISVVSVVPMRCGAFKYQELVLSDKNRDSKNFSEYLRDHYLETKLICNYRDDPFKNLFTIWRRNDSPDFRNPEPKRCELTALLLKTNATLFELVTVESVDEFCSSRSGGNKLIIPFSMVNGPNSMIQLNRCFLHLRYFKTTMVVVNEDFSLKKYINILVSVKSGYKCIEIKSIDESKIDDFYYNERIHDFSVGNAKNYSTIKQILQWYSSDEHRFYIMVNNPVTDAHNLIQLHGLVMGCESSTQLEPRNMNAEMLDHYLDVHTMASEELAKIVAKFIEISRSPDTKCDDDGDFDVTKNNELLDLLRQHPIFNDQNHKYTIEWSMKRFIHIICKRANIISEYFSEIPDSNDRRYDINVLAFAFCNKIDGAPIHCETENDDTEVANIYKKFLWPIMPMVNNYVEMIIDHFADLL